MTQYHDVWTLLNREQPPNPYIEHITGNHPDLEYVGFIARGSEGKVYLIKTLGPISATSPEYFARKVCKEEGVPQNEVRNIDKLASLPQHPNVMRVFRYGFLTSYRPSPEPHKHLPYYYFDMDLGRLSLYKYIETHFHVNPQIIPSPANLWDILSQVTSAVEYLHRNNLVHRDIKPDNIITSWSKSNVWLLTDFGISVISAGYLMSTTVGRGSDQYKAPEILSRNKYGTPVDIWGIGCLLYEIFAGHRLFKDSFEIEAYRNGTPLKQLLHPFDQVIATPPSLLSPQDKPIKFSFQVLSAPKREWTGITKIQLGHFWEAFKGMKETNGEVTGKVCEDVAHRLGEINALLRWMLNCDPTKRPTAKAVLHHFRGFYLRSMLEDDEVFRDAAVARLLLDPTGESPTRHDIIMDRWRFFIKLEAIQSIQCAEKTRLQLYLDLNILAKRFLTINSEYLANLLNQELLQLLSQNFELANDFKRIYGINRPPLVSMQNPSNDLSWQMRNMSLRS